MSADIDSNINEHQGAEANPQDRNSTICDPSIKTTTVANQHRVQDNSAEGLEDKVREVEDENTKV